MANYPSPRLAVDCVVFGFDEKGLRVMLIQRGKEPFKGTWALPGGFVHIDESVDDAARRELGEETGIRVFLEQLYTFGAVDRDPARRVVSVAYYALVQPEVHRVLGATDAADARWFRLDAVPSMPFDHQAILEMALTRLRGKVRYEPIGFELLPKKFTLLQLQRLYEIVLGRPLDKSNFRKKLLSFGILTELDEVQTDVAHRAARLYQFDERAYQAMRKKGIDFEL